MTSGQAAIDRWTYPNIYDMPEEFLEVVDLFQRYRGDEFHFLQEAALFIARKRGEVTSDDLYQLADFLGLEGDRRILGGVLGHLKHRGLLIPVRITRTERPEAHGRPIWAFTIPRRDEDAESSGTDSYPPGALMEGEE